MQVVAKDSGLVTSVHFPVAATIDIALLKNVKHRGGKIEAQCPACAETGADTTGNHLAIFDDGRFACVANEGDHDHRAAIFNLVGIKSEKREFTAAEKLEYGRRKKAEEVKRVHQQKIQKSASKAIPLIRQKFSWAPCDLWEDSPQRIDCDLVEYDPRYFLETLFQPSDIVWTGHTWQSGDYGQDRFKTPSQWKERPLNEAAPMTSPAVWNDGITSRNASNVKSSPYVVLDFDEIDGRKPDTAAEKKALVNHALAITSWLINEHGARLSAIIHTGNKSPHIWIESYSINVDELKGISDFVGIDTGLIGQSHHPCRLPGQRHEKSGMKSRVLWLK